MINKYLDLSTSHVDHNFSKFGTSAFRILEHEHGWIIIVPGRELDQEQVQNIKDQNAEYILDLIKYAQKEKCYLINLDCDGEKIEGLKTFDW